MCIGVEETALLTTRVKPDKIPTYLNLFLLFHPQVTRMSEREISCRYQTVRRICTKPTAWMNS